MTQTFYTDSHEWITVQENIGIVGITQHGQKELGEIVYLDLPKMNQALVAGQEACVLESTKAAADIYSPVSGKVIAVNEAVRQSPSLLNRSPEDDAWLYKIEMSNLSELKNLLSKTQYFHVIS